MSSFFLFIYKFFLFIFINEEIHTETYTLKKRIKIERWLDRYNHIMEFIRTILALTTIGLQLYIISKLTGG